MGLYSSSAETFAQSSFTSDTSIVHYIKINEKNLTVLTTTTANSQN